MPRSLIIGYGNQDRADDGVAYYVINVLRQRLGQEILREDETGLEALGAQVDSVFLMQLSPELVDLLVGYNQIVFVDAHVREDLDDLHCASVLPEYAPAAFTHHMSPAMLLALLDALHHRKPRGHIVSIRGREFDFHRGLSAAAEMMVQPAVEQILQLISQSEESSTP